MLRGATKKLFLVSSRALSCYPTVETNMHDFLQACKYDISKAESLFFRPALHGQVSTKQMIEIASCHESLSLQLLESQETQDLLDSTDLKMLCHPLKSAKFVLSNPELKDKLDGKQLYDIGVKSASHAMLIVQDPLLKQKVIQAGLYGHLVSLQKSLAIAALRDPDFRIQVTEHALSAILGCHNDLIWFIIKDDHLKKFLLPTMLASLASQSIMLAKNILCDTTLLSKLSHMALLDLATRFEEVALFMLDKPELRSRLDIYIFLSWVVSPHYGVAKRALEDEDLLKFVQSNTTLLKTIGKSHLGLIDKVIGMGILAQKEVDELKAQQSLATNMSQVLKKLSECYHDEPTFKPSIKKH